MCVRLSICLYVCLYVCGCVCARACVCVWCLFVRACVCACWRHPFHNRPLSINIITDLACNKGDPTCTPNPRLQAVEFAPRSVWEPLARQFQTESGRQVYKSFGPTQKAYIDTLVRTPSYLPADCWTAAAPNPAACLPIPLKAPPPPPPAPDHSLLIVMIGGAAGGGGLLIIALTVSETNSL